MEVATISGLGFIISLTLRSSIRKIPLIILKSSWWAGICSDSSKSKVSIKVAVAFSSSLAWSDVGTPAYLTNFFIPGILAVNSRIFPITCAI